MSYGPTVVLYCSSQNFYCFCSVMKPVGFLHVRALVLRVRQQFMFTINVWTVSFIYIPKFIKYTVNETLSFDLFSHQITRRVNGTYSGECSDESQFQNTSFLRSVRCSFTSYMIIKLSCYQLIFLRDINMNLASVAFVRVC